MEMLRDKIKGLEHKIIEMIRHGQDNEAIADRLHRFTQAILLTANPSELPEVIVRELKHEFMVPRAALRLWGAADPYTALRFAQGASATTCAASPPACTHRTAAPTPASRPATGWTSPRAWRRWR